MKSLADLEKIRRQAQERMRVRDGEGSTRIVVGMGTCGIAAGAREVLAAFMDELAKREQNDVTVTQTGCAGLCEFEPLVEVYLPGKERVTYSYVTPEKARQIVARHLVNKQVVGDWVLAKR